MFLHILGSNYLLLNFIALPFPLFYTLATLMLFQFLEYTKVFPV